MTGASTEAVHVDCASRTLSFAGQSVPCAIGRSGSIDDAVKREGDGCTPLGSYAVRAALFRPGRSTPPPAMTLPWRWTRPSDGWSDDPRDPCYNRPVRLPHPFSAEQLQRDDMLYDVVVILGHNDDPPEPGKGSAIFLHLWDEAKPLQDRHTEGCVAIARSAMQALLVMVRPGTRIDIA